MTAAGSDDGMVDYTVTYLEMTARPTGPFAPLPMSAPTSLIRANEPPLSWFLYLYRGVGAAHEWTDRLSDVPDTLRGFLHDPDISLYTLMHDGWAGGFFLLDHRTPGQCDLAYFGLMPDMHGRGYGKWLLGEAIRTGWDREGTRRMTVNTNTLDHPRALPLYQRVGFSPIRRVAARRKVTQPKA
ncbi:MAG: GNAT superfamily N-acetyltransferase [Paracoccaceae bacterium]|jgi:GNAT superfamily N-acetyltransferase